MKLKLLKDEFAVCRLRGTDRIDPSLPFCFFAHTDEEVSLVCRQEDIPEDTELKEEGWRAFRIEGILDFSLIGILAGITEALAAAGVGVFAVSTYNSDYIFVRKEQLEQAAEALRIAGYEVSV